MKKMRKSLLLVLVFALVTMSGCAFESNDSDTNKSAYVSYVSTFGPNVSDNNTYYHYVKNENGFIYSKIAKYDIKTSDDQVVFTLDDYESDNKRISDYYGNDNDLFIVVTENKNDKEKSFLYHHCVSDGNNQILTEISGSIYLIRAEGGIIIGIKDDDNNEVHYYAIEEDKSSFLLSEIGEPELGELNNVGASEIVKLEDGKSVTFTKNLGEARYSYSLDGKSGDIEVLTNKKAMDSGLYNDFCVEKEKVIGVVQFTEWKNGICPKNLLKPQNLKGSVLFEFDTDTFKSDILYEAKGNQTLIIGYGEGQVYLYKKGKVIKRSLDEKKEKTIYSVDKNNHQLSFNWLNDTLLIFDEDDYKIIGCCNG